jgi:hypothetical protein
VVGNIEEPTKFNQSDNSGLSPWFPLVARKSIQAELLSIAKVGHFKPAGFRIDLEL